MIICNLNVEDGLVNGTCGTLKYIQLDDKDLKPKILWFEFTSPSIGAIKRLNSKALYHIDINDNWTPLIKFTVDLSAKIGFKGQLTRSQFPIIPAEATTVHKSQGSTYEKVCVDLDGRFNKSMIYVALSRVTSISGLYLLGNIRKKPINKNIDFENEIKALKQEKNLKLYYQYEKIAGEYKIAYLNINSFITSS